MKGRLCEVGKLVQALSKLVRITLDNRWVDISEQRARNVAKELWVRVGRVFINRVGVILDKVRSEET